METLTTSEIIVKAQSLRLVTCSLYNPRPGGLTFVKNLKFLELLKNVEAQTYVIISRELFETKDSVLSSVPHINFWVVNDDPKTVFVMVHNKLNEHKKAKANLISENCIIHPSSIVGIDGHTIVRDCEDNKTFLKHLGNVVIEDGVRIDALSTIHRANLDSTIIKKNVTICSHVNIGHNCFIGEDSFIGPGTMIAGGCKIGKNCTIWQGALIKEKTSICDDVVIGMGSIVTRDIEEPGTYYGSPAILVRKKV